MNIFELIQREITAEQAGRLYGLKFAKNGRAFCPWHDDGKHPALAFYDGHCYCHACHNGGNAVNLTAQILGISNHKAALQLQQDFHLSQDVEYRSEPSTTVKHKPRKVNEREEFDKRWIYLCDVCHEAYDKLAKYTPDTIDDRFDLILGAMCSANQELDTMWEMIKDGRIG